LVESDDRAQSGIYVESFIQESVDRVWELTQDPELHQRWDLRFTQIRYLPRPDLAEPQRFLYTTRIGFGLSIEGTGESVGQRARDGETTSALRFESDDPKSLIREGSGYWRYMPVEGGMRFFTWYDYEVRFGALGRFADRVVFRPLFGWATAWSFDRLRLWAEKDQSPESSLRLSAIHALARITLAFVWIWHGLIPKLLLQQADEQRMLRDAGVPVHWLPWIGVVEIYFGVMLLCTWNQRAILLVNALLMVLATILVAVQSPVFLRAAFNPITLNVTLIALSLAGWIASGAVPHARRCRRRDPREPS
jgi:hypothetical protein